MWLQFGRSNASIVAIAKTPIRSKLTLLKHETTTMDPNATHKNQKPEKIR